MNILIVTPFCASGKQEAGFVDRRRLSIALAAFDRHMPFFAGWLAPSERFGLHALDVGMHSPGRDGADRHRRMLRDREFDIAEVSLASYLMARQQGADFIATPVFPRRLFSHNHIFVRDDSGIREPADLAGKTIAIRAFQVTLSVLAKGDLKSEHGVDWRSVKWLVEEPGPIAWEVPDGVSVEPVPAGATGADLLLQGCVDALIDPKPPLSILEGGGRVRLLHSDPRAACERYFKTRRAFPIMHVLAMRASVAAEFPELPAYLVEAWEEAKAMTRAAYADLAFTIMPFGRDAFERDMESFGEDPWPSGFAANASNLDWFQEYMVDQTLLRRPLRPAEMFHPSVLAS